MGSLVECGLANALIAGALALVALLAGRYSRRPALTHALWALVLLKLITPPLVTLPVEVLPALAEAPSAEPELPLVKPAPAAELAASSPAGEPPDAEPDLGPAPMKIEDLIAQIRRQEKAAASGMPVMPLVLPPAPATAPARRSAPAVERPAVALPPLKLRPAAPPPAKPIPWRDLLAFVGWVWLTGAALCLTLSLWRVLCFHRLLRYARPAAEPLQSQARALAEQLGLGRCPEVFLLPGPIPPLLWAATGRARLFFPGNLLPRLDEAGRAALLAHELAHLARRDHWVRWVELLAGCLYWWYPLVWLARQRLQSAEEECCDAWVVSALPGHGPAYAGALLETVDFLSREPAPLPPTASGFGRVHQLKRRLTMIVQGSTPRGLSLAGKLLVLALAVALPLAPGPARPAGPPPRKPGDKPAEKAKAKLAEKAKPDEALSTGEPDRYAPNSRVLASTNGQVWQAALSPDGKTLAVAHGGTEGEGALSLWAMPAGKMTALLVEAKAIRAVTFSPDGKHLATGEFDNSVKLRDPKTGAVTKTLSGHTASVNSIAFAPGSKTLLSGGLDNTVRYWDVSSGKNTRTLKDHTDWVLSIAVSPDGKSLVSASKDMTARVYDLPTGKPRHVLKGHSNWIEGCALSPDNDTVATVSHDRTMKLWSAKTGKLKSTLSGHNNIVNAVAFFDAGKAIATVSHDQTVKLWETATGRETASIANAHAERIYALAVSKDGKTLVSGSWDRSIKVWDVETREEQKKLQPKRYAPETTFPVLALAVSPDGSTLAVSGEEKGVKLLEAATGRLLHLLEGHDDMVGGVAFSPDGKTLATAGFDGDVRLWDVTTGKPKRTLKGHVNWVFCVAFSPDGTHLASGGYDKTVRLWNVEKGTEVAKLNKHKGGVRAIAYTRDGMRLASAGTDKLIRVWDLSKKEVAHALRGHEDVVRSIAFSPDGKKLVSGSEDSTVRLWDVQAEKQLASTPTNTGVRAVAWSPRGATIAVGGQSRIVSLHDPANLASRGNNFEHQGSVTALAFSADAMRLYSGSEDQTVRVREGQMPSRRPVVSHVGGNLMKFARFSPDGKWLAMGGEDKRVEVRPAGFGRLEASVGELGQSGYQVAVSADGKTVAVGCLDKTIRVFDRQGLRLKATLTGHNERVWSVAFSPDGKKLVSGSGSWTNPEEPGEVKVWDISGPKPKELTTLEGMSASVQAVAWSRDGKHLAVGSRDNLARIFDAASYKELHLLKGHTGEVRGIDFSRDSKHLATAGGDGAVRVWAVADGQELAVLEAHKAGEGTNSVAWAPDGKHIASVSNRNVPGQVFLWSVTADEDGKLSFGKKRTLAGFTGRTLACAFSPDSKTLVAGGGVTMQYGEVHLFDVASGRHLAALQGQTNWVEGVTYTPDGKSVIAAGGFNNRPGEMHVWNVERGGWAVDDAHKQSAFCAVWAPDSKTLFTGSYDGTIKFFDATTGKEKSKFDASQGGVRALAISKDGKSLVSGGHDGTVKLWDLEDDKDATELAKFDKVVNAVAFSPDGKHVAACSADPFFRDQTGAVKVIEIATGREQSGQWSKRAAMAVAFSPDGKHLATGGLAGQGIVVYHVADGKAVSGAAGASGVYALEYSKDGKWLASAHGNGNIELRDAKALGMPALCTGHTALVPALGFSPDSRTVAGASHDRTVKLFDVRPTTGPRAAGMPGRKK